MLQSQLLRAKNIPKFYRNHQWVTKPDEKGQSFFGISKYIIQYIVRFSNVNHEQFQKARYSLIHRQSIGLFLQQTQVLQKKQPLTLAQKILMKRFIYQQDQQISLLKTIEFDMSLTSPIKMRLLRFNQEIKFTNFLLNQEWIYSIQPMDMKQFEDGSLMSQQEYLNSRKYIPYQ